MNNIWFTSDTHYSHKNIVKGTTQWDDNKRCRDFDTVEEMNELLIQNINSVVKPNHVLYHLGDWSFGGHEQIKKFRERINCKEIHLIFGNHDQHITPPNSEYRKEFTSVQYYKELSFKIDSQISGIYGKTKIILFHFPIASWNNMANQSIHLFGHCHGTFEPKGRSMDVGVDTNNLYPYHLDEIIYKFKNVVNKSVDHHIV